MSCVTSVLILSMHCVAAVKIKYIQSCLECGGCMDSIACSVHGIAC